MERRTASGTVAPEPTTTGLGGTVDCRAPAIYCAYRSRGTVPWWPRTVGLAAAGGSPRVFLFWSRCRCRCVRLLTSPGRVAFAVALAACAAHQALPDDPAGRLFARSLDEITDLYITPVSSRKLILAGAARFSRLDSKFSVTENSGPEGKTKIVVNYDGREVAAHPTPGDDDPHAWGGLMGRLIAGAKVASPTLATLSEDQIDKVLFDGMTGALDRFSRYASPEIARDQRASRDGFGGIGIRLRCRIPDHPSHTGWTRRSRWHSARRQAGRG